METQIQTPPAAIASAVDTGKSEAAATTATETKAATLPAVSNPGEIAVGSKVHLVHAWNGHIEATITGLQGGGFADLDSVDPRTSLHFVITRSPRDDSGTRSDSWHPIEREG